MSIHFAWATIAKVCEHTESGINSLLQLIESGITMPRTHDDPLICQKFCHFHVGISFGSKSYDARQSIGSIKQLLHLLNTCHADSVYRMGANIAIPLIDKRSLYMNTRNDVPCNTTFIAGTDNLPKQLLHNINIFRNNCCQNIFHSDIS